MPDPPTDLVQGTLEMLILKTLALESMHGYGITLRIEQISKGVFRVNAGSLLPALSRMNVQAGSKPSGELQRTIAAPNITRSPLSAEKPLKTKPCPGDVRSLPSAESWKVSKEGNGYAAKSGNGNQGALPSRAAKPGNGRGAA